MTFHISVLHDNKEGIYINKSQTFKLLNINIFEFNVMLMAFISQSEHFNRIHMLSY